jgi:hypothetical protein
MGREDWKGQRFNRELFGPRPEIDQGTEGSSRRKSAPDLSYFLRGHVRNLSSDDVH